jgi:hypothetical protein
MDLRTHFFATTVIFFMLTKIKTPVDQKWSANHTLGNTAIQRMPLNGITLGQALNDPINRMKLLSKYSGSCLMGSRILGSIN